MKKFNCPVCNKELVRLEPFIEGVYEFWCDACDIDIAITKNDEVSEDEFDFDEEYVPSASRRDYGPSNPWDAPGMSIKDFI